MKRGWLATVAGCGILLVLIAVFAITTQRGATRIYSELSANDRTIETLEIQLNGIQSDIFLSGIYLRDQLLDPLSPEADIQRTRLHEVHAAMEQHFRRISELVPGEQASHIGKLRQEIDSYWNLVSPLAEDPSNATAQGYAAIRSELTAKRDASLAIAREIGRLNRTSYEERHTRIEAAQTAFLKYIWTMMAVTLTVGVAVLAASGYIVGVLNRRTEAHRKGTARVENELHQLSAELFHTQEHERRVLSRELHDEVGQTLTALGMVIGNIENLTEEPDPEFMEQIGEAKKLTQDTLKTVRRLAMGLRPAMLDDSGLEPAVRYQAREFSRHSGISSTVEISGPMDHLPDAYRTCVYRVVQEALTNCGRHANAKNVRITLNGDLHSISLSIEDDGIGLGEVSSSGIGLTGIGERARELNGHVHLSSNLNSGTILRVDLPLPAAAAI